MSTNKRYLVDDKPVFEIIQHEDDSVEFKLEDGRIVGGVTWTYFDENGIVCVNLLAGERLSETNEYK